MFEHYFKVALRNFVKDKGYSAVNLVGLALAVACSFLFVLWVQYENNYESAHVHRKEIYRVLTAENVNGEWIKHSAVPSPLGKALTEEFPQVANATYLNVARFPDVLVYNEQPYSVIRGETNNRFFEVFTFEFIQGSPETAFEGERPIVISEDFAKKIFGTSDNIVGQPIYDRYRLWDNKGLDHAPYLVTGVVRIPGNTHIRFDALMDAGKTSHHGNASRSWQKRGYYTAFVQMAPNAVFDDATRARMANYLTKHLPNDKSKLIFQPLTDIHLHPDVTDANLSGEFGEPRYIFIFLTMALFVLVIAVINHVNLSIARSANRSREVGVRKVEGAYKRELVWQFLSESMLWSFAAMLLAFVLAEIIIPWFSSVVGAVLTIDYSFRTFATALGLCLFVGLLTGGYSAFYLSSFRPALILKGGSSTGSKASLRKALLGVQLAISIFIMLCTGIVYRQLHYIQTRDIGFDRYNVIGINTGLWYGVEDFKKEVLKNAQVEAVSIACYSPVDMNWGATLKWDGKTSETDEGCNIIFADWDYAKVFRLQMTQGAFLPENMTWWQYSTEDSYSKVLNEAAAKVVGKEDIVGTKVNNGKVVGVIRDFNFRSFHEKITPLIIEYNPEASGKVFIRISPHHQKETLDYIRGVFRNFKKDNPFEYFFMEDEYMAIYQKEFRLGRIFLYFSLLSIFISCMGVFSLVAFMVEHRSKEISVRKINGAKVMDIVWLFAREFTVLTAIAFVAASPFAWFAMNRWLQTYQYRISIGIWIFVGVLALIWLLTMLTLLAQVYRAARRNPVESLKYE
ncbi:MAG: ABC transporter permease [Bacteroidales bacterium]|jgi:putative ABC transport system permease protein|nr:ABC transporter permease [Bacteroidales bacterium]